MKQDWHDYAGKLEAAERKLELSSICARNKQLIRDFKRQLLLDGISKARILVYASKLPSWCQRELITESPYMNRAHLVRISGELACFTRPEMKVERVSYDVITPSAARGVLEAVLWKPQMRWVIRRITVLNPIRFTAVKRNEIASKIPSTFKAWANANRADLGCREFPASVELVTGRSPVPAEELSGQRDLGWMLNDRLWLRASARRSCASLSMGAYRYRTASRR